ncbi:MAG: hypothetical protein HZA58_02665, partial [Acidimicrobiia bacterium]|nr:hypothetical protein [Acidimicrobiia bacterium]
MRRTRVRRGAAAFFLLLGFASAAGVFPAEAAPALSVQTITWDVIGLDSNDVAVGINRYPVAARVCNSGDAPSTSTSVAFVWDSVNPYIDIQSGTSSVRTLGTLAAGDCRDVTFTVEIARDPAAYTTSRRYHVEATADGGLLASSPVPREVYVEYLVSQNRNTVTGLAGPSTMFVGDTHTYRIEGGTAPGGYEQLQTFITADASLIEIGPTSVVYTEPVGATNDQPYGDACGWDPDPTSPTYRSCIGPPGFPGGKAGGDFSQTYLLKAVAPGSTQLGAMIYDFSGSSFHYNSDVGSASVTVQVLDPSEGALVSGLVWWDLDGDGVRDESAPVGGVPVEVWGVGWDGIAGTWDDFLQRSTTTIADGTYEVLVPPGELVYLVFAVETPIGFSPPNVGDDALDSDVVAVTTPGATATMSFPNAGLATGPDAGIVGAGLGVAKTASVNSISPPGEDVTFTVEVTNGGTTPFGITDMYDDIYGDLLDTGNPQVQANTCPAISRIVDGGAVGSCSFSVFVPATDESTPHTDTVTVHATMSGFTFVASGSATVPTDLPPTLTLTKTPSPGVIDEPGGWVTFSIDVGNTSAEAVTLTALFDDVFGDLLDPANPAVVSNTCAAAPTSIAAGASLVCSFEGFVSGSFGDPNHLDTVTADVVDDEANPASADASAMVSFTDAMPVVTVDKVASAASVTEPGAVVTFTLTLTNASVEPVTISALGDDVFGDLLDAANPDVAANTCTSLPATLGVGAAFGCSFEAFVGGNGSDPDHVDTVALTVTDDDGNPATAQAGATVGLDDAPPSATVVKDADPGTITEPGGTVTFIVTIDNTGPETLVIDSLTDSVFGDLRDAGNAAVSNNTCPALGGQVPAGGWVACWFDADVAGLFGDPDHVDLVTATLSDDEGNAITPSDDAVVVFAPANSTIGGRVFGDLDRDGFQDGSESGLGGVEVEVTSSGGAVTNVTTAADGTWSAAVLPGPASVEVDPNTVPSGYSLTTANQTQSVMALVGQHVAAEDIGYGPPPGALQGMLFLDLDGDPNRDPDEPPLPGLGVQILQGSTVIAGTTSNGSGGYSFGGLPAGNYTVRVIQATIPAGYASSVDYDGGADGSAVAVVLSGATTSGVDFGHRGTGTVGDTVWLDEDEDG